MRSLDVKSIWWRHDMAALSASLTLYVGNTLVPSWFPSQLTSNVEIFLVVASTNSDLRRHGAHVTSRQYFADIKDVAQRQGTHW